MSKELNLEKVTPQEYRRWLEAEVKAGRMPKGELELIHVRKEQKMFDGSDYKVNTDYEIQKFGVREWGSTPTEKQWDYYERKRTSPSGGFEYTILFNPRDNGSEQEPATEDEQTEETKAAENGSEPATEKKQRGRKPEKETISLGE